MVFLVHSCLTDKVAVLDHTYLSDKVDFSVFFGPLAYIDLTGMICSLARVGLSRAQ